MRQLASWVFRQNRSTNRSRLFVTLGQPWEVLHLLVGSKKDKRKHFMDKTARVKELTEDLARESLIAISCGVPVTDPHAEVSPTSVNGEKVVEPLIRDGEEKYRSELISISYSLSPDVNVLDLLRREIEG